MSDLIIEHLKRIQADIADMKRDIHDMKAEIVSLRTIMGEFIKTDAP